MKGVNVMNNEFDSSKAIKVLCIACIPLVLVFFVGSIYLRNNVSIVNPNATKTDSDNNSAESINDEIRRKYETKRMQIAAETIADWAERQYLLYFVGIGRDIDENFKNVCITNNCISSDGLTASYLSNDVWEMFKSNNDDIKIDEYKSFLVSDDISANNSMSYIIINSSNSKSCVKISTVDNKTYCSSHCTKEQCISNVTE